MPESELGHKSLTPKTLTLCPQGRTTWIDILSLTHMCDPGKARTHPWGGWRILREGGGRFGGNGRDLGGTELGAITVHFEK